MPCVEFDQVLYILFTSQIQANVGHARLDGMRCAILS